MIDLRILLYSLAFGVAASFGNHYRDRRMKGYTVNDNRPWFESNNSFALILLPLFFFLPYFFRQDAAGVYSFYIVKILTLTGGLGLLLLLLPVLRKVLSPGSCANLWLMLCALFCFAGFVPQWTIALPFPPPSEQLFRTLTWIWLAGFAAVLLWSILSHLLFRHRLLRNAKPVKEEGYLWQWQWQLNLFRLPTDQIRLCVSPDTQTPLSIGLLKRSTYLVLPEKAYSPEELGMILQHELVHISRGDSEMKFALTLWAALMWYNPLSWIALRACAQDLELSCDEAVLFGRPQQDRMEYARLLLNTAPKQHGFTSCLSASATTLRYRLKNVVNAPKRIVGSVIIGCLCFLLLLGGMGIGIRYQAVPAKELVFEGTDVSQLTIGDVYFTIDGIKVDIKPDSDALLLDYIAALPLQQTTEKPDIFSQPTQAQLTLGSSDRGYMLNFGGCCLRVIVFNYTLPENHPAYSKTTYYWLDTSPDWQIFLA